MLFALKGLIKSNNILVTSALDNVELVHNFAFGNFGAEQLLAYRFNSDKLSS